MNAVRRRRQAFAKLANRLNMAFTEPDQPVEEPDPEELCKGDYCDRVAGVLDDAVDSGFNVWEFLDVLVALDNGLTLSLEERRDMARAMVVQAVQRGLRRRRTY